MTRELQELINLCELAKHHKQTCEDGNCNISLRTLGQTALRLLNIIMNDKRGERGKAQNLYDSVEWF